MTEEMTPSPEISVVIPCYNSEEWIGRAIDSVLAQEGVTVEVIVIDDGSTDRSLEVVRSYGDRISWETGPNRGACAARNQGLTHAQADYVMFLDADDFVEGALLSGMRDALRSSQSACCIGPVVDKSADATAQRRRPPDTTSWETLIVDWLDGQFIPPCGVMWRRTYLQELGGWDEALSKNQDGEIILRAAAQKATFCNAADGHGVYWHHSSPDRISQNLSPRKARHALAVHVKLLNQLVEANSLTANLERALSNATHRLERACVKQRLLEEVERVADFRKQRDWPRYPGTVAHVLACRIFGLEKKEAISRSLRGFAQSVRLPKY